jgi:predicted outer membrane repeat protein
MRLVLSIFLLLISYVVVLAHTVVGSRQEYNPNEEERFVAETYSFVISVNNFTDNYDPSDSYCASYLIPHRCNIRSAWLYCNSVSTSSASPCLIQLPSGTIHNVVDRGSLFLSAQDNIKIDGQGAIVMSSSTAAAPFIVTDCTEVNQNTYPSLQLTRLTFQSFYLTDGFGSVLSINCHTVLTLSNSSFVQNYAEAGGGALSITNNPIATNITHCTFTKNTAALYNAYGGALYFSQSMHIVIQSSIFQGAGTSLVAEQGKLIS